jgi:hypothetical protein
LPLKYTKCGTFIGRNTTICCWKWRRTNLRAQTSAALSAASAADSSGRAWTGARFWAPTYGDIGYYIAWKS